MNSSTHAIKCVQERVQEPLGVDSPISIIGLVQCDALRMYDGICQFEVEIRLSTSLANGYRSLATVDEGGDWVGALRNILGKCLEEQVKVLLGIDVPFLENAQGIVWVRRSTRGGDLIQCPNAVWRD